jgi:Fe-S cluster assembly ATP-binding protein
MLNIQNLCVEVQGKKILDGFSLFVPPGQVHAIMGPNGTGKSTLSYALAGRSGYDITDGSVTLNGRDILPMSPDERAAAGLFLAFQYPPEIPGVAMNTFLKESINALRRARGLDDLSALDLLKTIKSAAEKLGVPDDMLKRPVNVGASGGEKKRNDILQMTVLNPSFCILDETDSGLDIDALRIVADGVNALRAPDRSFLMITHYQRLLDYIKPDVVHVMQGGKIVKSGGPDLAKSLEETGYAAYGGRAS